MRILLYYISFASAVIICISAYAQSENQNNFFDNLLISDKYAEEFAKQQKNEQISHDARSILRQKQKQIDVKDDRKLRIEDRKSVV